MTTRTALLVTHTGRKDSTEHARTVAAHLIRAGFTVRVMADEASDVDIAGTVPVTGETAAKGAEIVFACVGNDDDLRSVVNGPDGAFAGMAKGTLFVDHTTASAEVARELKEHGLVRSRLVAYVVLSSAAGEKGIKPGSYDVSQKMDLLMLTKTLTSLPHSVFVTIPASVRKEQIGELLAEADILAAPRIRGSNTPMKIFPYLHSGRPVLVTAVPSHTQALDSSVCELAAPDPNAFGGAIVRLARDPELRRRLGAAGRAFIERNHVFEAHVNRVRALYTHVAASVRGDAR